MAFGMFSQQRPELGQISFDRLHDEFFGERFVLIIVGGAGFDRLGDEQKNADRVEWDKECQSLDDRMRGVRMHHRREGFQ